MMKKTTFQQTKMTRLFAAVIMVMGLIITACDDDSTGTDEDEVFFSSGQIQTGETFEFTFESEGTVPYYCSNHEPDMTGRITVESNGESTNQDTVRMEDHSFNPDRLTVSVNTTVVWVNDGEEAHTVRSGTPSSDDNGGGY